MGREGRGPAWLWAAGIALALLLPVPDLPASDSLPRLPVPLDLLVHGALFFVLVLLAIPAFGRARRVGLMAAAYGVLTEAAQALVPYRSAEWSDLWADWVGIALALVWCTLRSRAKRP
ncbi:MAG: VanZ family protein [Acidobacteriota bacterium]